MLKLSSRTIYGVAGVFELARQYRQGPTRVADISKQHQIPRNYLDQILLELKKAGLVESHRGARGGYTLEKSPEKISVWDVVEVLHGKVSMSAAVEVENPVLKNHWAKLDKEIKACFQTTYQELLDDWQRHQGALNYSI